MDMVCWNDPVHFGSSRSPSAVVGNVFYVRALVKMVWLNQGQSGHCFRDQHMWRIQGKHSGIQFHPATFLLLKPGTRCIHRHELFSLAVLAVPIKKHPAVWGVRRMKKTCVCVHICLHGQDCTGSEPHLV